MISPGEPSSHIENLSWASAAARPATPGRERHLHVVSTAEPVDAYVTPEESFGTDGVRRWLNVAVATTALLLLLPVMALVALAVRLTSSGPILFRQERVGLDRRSRGNGRQDSRRQRDLGGRPFVMYKFRTMYQDAGSRGQVWASPDDPRVTPVGRFLRKTRLDELPQLWNVLKGDMNIVGPRPEQPDIFCDLRTRLDQYHRRQRVLPGITGHAQINLNYDSSVESVRQKLLLDLQYIERVSATEDLRIMLRTLPVMVTGKGAW